LCAQSHRFREHVIARWVWGGGAVSRGGSTSSRRSDQGKVAGATPDLIKFSEGGVVLTG
jgi:hypothetical protein